MPTKLEVFLNGDGLPAGESKYPGHKVQPGQGKPYTFQAYGDYSKMWFVDEDEMDTFRALYCADLNNSAPLYYTEKSTAVGHLRVDLDIKFNGHVEEHKHTQAQVISFMKAYMEEVSKYVEVPDDVEIFVLEKDYPTFDTIKKISASGIHVQIPSIKTRAGVEQAVRRALVKRMEEFFPKLGFMENKTWDDVYDKQPLTHTNMWMVLGSKKNEGLPYKIRYILDWEKETGDISVDNDIPKYITPDLVKKLSVRSSPAEETPMTDLGTSCVRVIPEREVIPISGGRAVSAPRGRQTTRDQSDSRASSPGRNYIAPLSDALLRYYRAHVENLAEFRCTTYAEWINVGQCLKNIHPDLEDVWLDFSSQDSTNYNPREAVQKWNSFGFRSDGLKLGVGTLRFWSRTDNMVGYAAAETQNVDRLIEESAQTSTEHDVARVVFAKYGDEFKCAKYGNNVWYQFDRHTWRETDKGIALQCRLSSDISRAYLEKEAAEVNNIRIAGECDHKDMNPECESCKAEQRKKSFSGMRMKLKTSRFKENVMKECRELFLDETLANKLDENKNLIAFRNGVFDTMTMEFRDGQPEDYISFSTNIDYDPEKHYSTYECWSQIDKFLRDVLPDTAVRNYFIHHLSTCLSGGNEAQKFHILTGSGSNGKSMLMNLMSTAMGDYTCKAPISLLTQGRNKSAAAAPELVRMKGRRFVTMQEPDEEVPLNTGLMKELASCEKVTARDLYAGSKAMIDFDIQARFHLACNEKPKINATDGGTWRRLVVINFPSKFVAEPKLANEKPIDESLVQKMIGTEWATCFMSYLVSTYKEGNGWRKIVPPGKVMEYTSEYQEESDVIARFIREFVHPLDSTEIPDPVSTQQLNSTFGEWKRSNEIHKGSPAELRKRIEAQFGKYPRTGWTSFQFGSS